jgi:transposase
MNATVNEIELIDGLAQEERMPKHIIGMDVHSRKVSLCISLAQYGRDPIVLRELACVHLDSLESTYRRNVPLDSVTIIEASTNAFAIVKRLKRIGYSAKVVYSDILRGLARKDRINDRIDASRLAVAYCRFGATREGIFVPSDRFASYRDLLFGYKNTVKDLTRISNRIWAFCSAHGMPLPKRKKQRKVSDVRTYAQNVHLEEFSAFQLEDLLSEYEHCLKRRDTFHRKIALVVSREPTMIRLMQVPGISAITAFALVAYIENIHRFSSPSKLVSYIGLNPMVNSSGESGNPDSLSSYGQRILKILFLQVGQALVRRTTKHSISSWARKKIASGKPYLVMCAAAGRKAIVYAWHNMMGHPAPDRECEKMFRTKVMSIYKELGGEAEQLTGFRKSSEYAKAVMMPLYAHLSAQEP